MEGQEKSDRYRKRLKILAATMTILILVAMVALAAFFSYFFYVFGTLHDPYAPRAPYYEYEVSVTGLDGFTTEDGSAELRLPLPGDHGKPLLQEGWWVNYYTDYRYRYHGMTGLSPENTSVGQMLTARINMTDYYESYASATPIPIMPGQNESALPTIVPARVEKPWSFDDVKVIASGYVGSLNYGSSPLGRQANIDFLQTPLLPAAAGSGGYNYTTYVYIDPALRSKNNDSAIRITGSLVVSLNHNKVNASEEGKRSFEEHRYVIDESIPGGVTGYVPVAVHYSCAYTQ